VQTKRKSKGTQEQKPVLTMEAAKNKDANKKKSGGGMKDGGDTMAVFIAKLELETETETGTGTEVERPIEEVEA
jgi:hypothetical protein